jgi:hypothetical protein
MYQLVYFTHLSLRNVLEQVLSLVATSLRTATQHELIITNLLLNHVASHRSSY